MLDVHILTMPSSRQDWFDQCVESVMDAAERAGFPVDVHIVAGVAGHIGKGRADGYSRGNHAYVTCVDDDDYVLPHAFVQMRYHLQSGTYKAISTPEYILRNSHKLDGKQRHHLIAYKRNMVIDHAPWACCGDVAQAMRISEGDWKDLTQPAYVHRVYESRARLMRREHQDELAKACAHG